MNNAVMRQLIQNIQDMVSANKGYYRLWKNYVIFTWQWWIQLVLTIVPIIIWLVLRKRNSTGRLLYAGLFVLIVTSWWDFLGNALGLWYYAMKLIPTLPPFFPWETLIAVELMLLLQYKPNFSPWLKAIAFGMAIAFVGEPLMNWMGLYTLVHWRYIYSFPIYIIIYIAAHSIVHVDSFGRLDDGQNR